MNRFLFLIFSLYFSSLQATENIFSENAAEMPTKRLTAPFLTYDDIKDQLPESGKQWTEINVISPLCEKRERWHFHWHMAIVNKIENQFPPDQYEYFISRLKDLEPTAAFSNFATYVIYAKHKQTTELMDIPFYIFYLTDPDQCTLSHLSPCILSLENRG